MSSAVVASTRHGGDIRAWESCGEGGKRVIELVPYGRPAREALAARISAEKSGDSLAPLTVVVPSNYAGLSLRRALAASTPTVNVRFIMASRLAELLGAPALAAQGLRPLTPWIRLQAVRAALHEAPGVFAEVQDHKATPLELQRVFAELREATDAARTRVAVTSPRAADVVRLYRRFRDLTNTFFDESDLMASAAINLQSGSAAAVETGAIVLYLPRDVSGSLAALLAAADGSRTVHAILGLTGDASVDEATAAMARKLPGGEQVARSAADQPGILRVLSATDPEEEVREATRQAMALARNGMPLHRIAITYNAPETYAGLLDDALTSAGVPHNGPPTRTLAQTIAGRTLLGLPRIAASAGPGDPGYAREDVMDWLTSAPVHSDHHEAPTHRWDEISRDAGIVRGPAQWRSRLELHAVGQEERAIELGIEGESSYTRTAAWARSLASFIDELAANLGADETTNAAMHARKALGWLDAFLPERALDDESQLEARIRVERQLDEVISLERALPPELDRPLTRAAFAAALEEALSVPFGRVGKLGDGVFIGPLTLVGEMEFDAVIVLGMVEGAFPSASKDDPVLTADERASVGSELPSGRIRQTEEQRSYLSALLAAGTRMLSYPRADLRAQRASRPSRWLLEGASALHGSPIYGTDLAKLLSEPPDWFRVVNSFESALGGGGERASLQEWDLSSLVAFRGRLDRHFLLQTPGHDALARGVAARVSRARYGSGRLDGWSGKVPPHRAPLPNATQAIAPTTLEKFAMCPFQYFLGHVLRVGEVELPEEVVTIEPAVIGNVVHKILQRFFESTKGRPDPVANWTDDERGALHTIAGEVFADFERRGMTGKLLTWRAEQARLLRDLDLLLDEEIRERRATGMTFQRAEASFGVQRGAAGGQAHAAAVLPLPNGESLSFRGVVDRIDVGPNGELAITDYKTGSTRSYDKLKEDDATLGGGRFLQLPVYALAFRDESTAPVRASYWFVSESAGFVRKPIILNEKTYTAFGGIVNTLLETMRTGYFPAVPGEEDWRGSTSWTNCRYCAYDQVCPSANRIEAWDALKQDPGLAAFAGLAKGEAPGDADHA